jgi:hypothetical protein
LTDPVGQRARFRAGQGRKQVLYGETYPIDEDFLKALEYGMPPSAGARSALTASSLWRPTRKSDSPPVFSRSEVVLCPSINTFGIVSPQVYLV